jgi:hypothetical protein
MCNNCEQLQLATLRLSQDGSIKDRLVDAWSSHLVTLEAEELPEPMRAPFAALSAAMHREPPLPRENAVRASVRKMSVQEASAHAALVVRLFAATARAEAACMPAARAPRVAAPVVKLFAAEPEMESGAEPEAELARA